VARKILENALVMSVNFSSAETIPHWLGMCCRSQWLIFGNHPR
jgi:hypothetical protein